MCKPTLKLADDDNLCPHRLSGGCNIACISSHFQNSSEMCGLVLDINGGKNEEQQTRPGRKIELKRYTSFLSF